MTEICLIPARLGSSRFPAKPLAPIMGKAMILHVLERCAQAFGIENTYAVTDSKEIVDVADAAGFRALVVEDDVATGTDRIAIAARQFPTASRFYNVQGDEPLVDPEELRRFRLFSQKSDSAVTNSFSECSDINRAKSENSIKMVISSDQSLMYASRSHIPFGGQSDECYSSYLQFCVYSFLPESLEWFLSTPRGPTEISENIEILRFLEHGKRVSMMQSFGETHAVDVPEDIAKVEALLTRSSSEIS